MKKKCKFTYNAQKQTIEIIINHILLIVRFYKKCYIEVIGIT